VGRSLYATPELSFFVSKSATVATFETVQLNFYMMSTIQQYN
jgi:hypothetical protein